MQLASEEDHFVNDCYSKNIDCILPMTEMLVNFKMNGMRTKKSCFAYAEKMDLKGLIQIRLTEKCDQRRMYITTVDSSSFVELKQEQSLHVTFSGFIDNLKRLLHDCQEEKLEIYIVQSKSSQENNRTQNINGISIPLNSPEYQLQFLEPRPFKNLIHLSLPCRLAPLNIVLFYMNSIMDVLQKKISLHDQTTNSLKQELLMHQRRNEQLEVENRKLRESLQDSTHSMSQRHLEDLQQLEENIRKANEQHYNDNEKNRKIIADLQSQIDKLNMEKGAIRAEKTQELKRIESIGTELCNANGQIDQLKIKNEELQAEVAVLKNQERKSEMHLSDARKHINDLQDKLKKHDKNKADIIAELEAEKKISLTKRQALEVTTEEISKANEIIYKQAQELLKLKQTVAWRTEIALEQEKAIQEKDRENSIYEEELKQTKLIVNCLRDEVPQQLESLRKFANSLEKKYKEEISALRESLKLNQERSRLTSSRRK